MATTIDTHENIQQAPENTTLEADLCRLSATDESAGYIVYLTERELFEAYPRAKRENPDAVVHFERHVNDLWSLEVYKSEAAKQAYLTSFYYREKALASLTVFYRPRRLPDA